MEQVDLENLDMINIDCGDTSCLFAKDKSGMRTNGGCRCLCGEPFVRRIAIQQILQAFPALRDELRELREFRDKVLAPTTEDVVVLSTKERESGSN